jgi:hypothetical protein
MIVILKPIDFIVSHGSMESNLKVEYFAFSVKVAIFSSISDRSVFKDSDDNKYQINTKYKPHDITTLPGTNLVVASSINSHNMQFIDIVRKNLCNEIHITGSERGGYVVMVICCYTPCTT